MNTVRVNFLCKTLFLITITVSAQAVHAVMSFDANVTNNVIYGMGNTNGSFTVDRANGIELGLRAKVRFDAANQPQNVFNSNGDGTYSFAAGLPPTGFSFAPNSPSTASWNFDWSINSDFDRSSNFLVDDLVYLLEIDFNPTAGTNFLAFDPISGLPVVPDHSFGNNTTAQGDGAEATDAASYAALIASSNLAQNSWNMEFFDNGGIGFPFNGDASGIYDFRLSAGLAGTAPLASTNMQVIVGVIPEPTTLALLSLGLVGLGIRKKAA